jgi:hypothetical protein
MRKLIASLLAIAALSAAAHFAVAGTLTYTLPEETVKLRPGLDAETARNNCTSCHSVDYIAMQPPKKGKAFWEAEVTKMIKVYHAPIEQADAAAISEYLGQTY